ncbi:MAG: LysR family transcriptional regulator [Dysosmobacter sp.]
MAVKLELYRVFKEVAETGNISAAAKNLHISQSAVSQSIKQLETALQARLFAGPPGRDADGRGPDALSSMSATPWVCWLPARTRLSQAQQLCCWVP